MFRLPPPPLPHLRPNTIKDLRINNNHTPKKQTPEKPQKTPTQKNKTQHPSKFTATTMNVPIPNWQNKVKSENKSSANPKVYQPTQPPNSPKKRQKEPENLRITGAVPKHILEAQIARYL